MKSLKGTKTAVNLMKAFAGESQARNRYTFFASVAKKEGYVQISRVFEETANQEKEHAKRFYKFLKDDFIDESIEITASFPVALHTDTVANLKAAATGENEEWVVLYPEFAKIAKEEGFEEVAAAFNNIAKVEKWHEDRYKKLAENIIVNKTFKEDKVERWQCQNCGYIHEGEEAPYECPACAHPQGYFKRFREDY
ncbi:MAG: rubrerythrin [Cellulosilyticaceae bacterium]